MRLTDDIALPVPADRAPGAIAATSAATALTFGLAAGAHHRMQAQRRRSNSATFDAVLEVIEPMGMETLVFFRVNGREVCGRVSPNAGAREGAPMRLAANLDNMHLIDEATGRVI